MSSSSPEAASRHQVGNEALLLPVTQLHGVSAAGERTQSCVAKARSVPLMMNVRRLSHPREDRPWSGLLSRSRQSRGWMKATVTVRRRAYVRSLLKALLDAGDR